MESGNDDHVTYLYPHNSSVEGARKLKFVSFYSLEMLFLMVSLFAEIASFSFWPKSLDYNKAFRSNFFPHS